MADTIFHSARAAIAGDTAISSSPIDFEADTLKFLLLKDTYTIDATDVYVSDLTPGTNEVPNGSGYTTGGATLTGVAVTYSTGTTTIDANDPEWTTSTITARYGVLYKDSGVTSTSPLLFLYDFGSNKSSSGGTFKVAFNVGGIVTIT